MKERGLDIKEHLSSGEHIFKDGVFFVPGVLRGAIYDVNSSRIYSINHSACDILIGVTKNLGFWKKLETMDLVTQEKSNRRSMLQELMRSPSLQFVWFEIVSNDCNESCIHCYAECMPPTYQKAMGISKERNLHSKQSFENNKGVSFEKWKEFIDESYYLGCRRCQFIGGEPLLYKGENGETVFDLAEYSKNVGYEYIEIFTNATMLTPKKIQRIKALGINVATSLYSNDEKLHDSITKTPGSFRKTIEALKFLKEVGVPVRVETVLMSPNEQTIKQTQELVEEMGFSHKQPDVLRPKGRGDNPSIMPTKKSIVKYSLMMSPNFTISKDIFSRNTSGHSCLQGKITITDNGNVLPCIFSRDLIVGNALEVALREIVLGQKLETVWRNTKDNVLVCQDCEYRYACFDCRPLAEGANQNQGEYFSAPYPRCTYNPYRGEWAKGAWRLNGEGKPYYDETLEPFIKKVVATQGVEVAHPIEY
ncbi:radical SAM protein [Patescibacteria group bacterium]|nr:radical SAM protein [Patescibacteria group bacterium]MBU0777211.1 radical SAM protein [Patescibacteria group bacterium]MBU0922933.1 radical SAM protein [Patescibacteria group bacterium]MBU1066210.1 radical SAM protein [Patescibacteria group bacterium]MBU1844555.1 radical SAM protein [Patescibacteria group bacterium]